MIRRRSAAAARGGAQARRMRRLAAAMPDQRDRRRVRHADVRAGHGPLIGYRLRAQGRQRPGSAAARSVDEARGRPRRPQSGAALASQATYSRLENAPRKVEAARSTDALVDQFGATVKPGNEEIVDIDDNVLRGARRPAELAFWNAHQDERGFATMHINHVGSGTSVCAIQRPARTPKRTEVRTVVKHVTRRLKRHWPRTRSDLARRQPLRPRRGDGMVRGQWRGLQLRPARQQRAGCAWLRRPATTCASGTPSARRRSCAATRAWSTRRGAGAGTARDRAHRVLAAAGPEGAGILPAEVDIRYVATSLEGSPEHLYENVDCQRGQMENLIKLRKAQLASDRMSCPARPPTRCGSCGTRPRSG